MSTPLILFASLGVFTACTGDTTSTTEPTETAPPGPTDTSTQDTSSTTDSPRDSPPQDSSPTDTEPPPECDEVHGTGEPLALVNDCGTLSYGLYAARDESEAHHRLPDFSWAGYARGGVALPDVAVALTLSPGSGDDHTRIQDALDTVAALPLDADGHRGAVLLTAGEYEVGDTLTLTASGVVLRGEGQGREGTVLTATKRSQHDLILVQGEGSGLGEVSGTRTDITTSLVPVGARSFDVADTSKLAIGDTIAVLRTPNEAWIEALGMAAWDWVADDYEIAHERQIVGLDGTTLTVDIPLVDAIDEAWGGGEVFVADLSGRIEQVGVEHLRLVSEHDGPEDEEHGWVAVQLRRTTNSWVRGITAEHFGYAAVSLASESSFNTVQDSASLSPVSEVTGSRRYAFNLTDGVGNLFQRCYSEEGRHDFVSSSRTTGPNVWLDCYSENSSNDDGPHHRWATGVMLDNVVSLDQHVENRQSSGTGHGWSGAQTLFWNTLAEGVICDAPQHAMNWSIGVLAAQEEGSWAPEEPPGWFESLGSPVEPRSLYLKQLETRLGTEAVQAVTSPAQRQGRIWDRLASWAGEGPLDEVEVTRGDPRCEEGIASGTACCAASCGECGGTGCSEREGGADACCTSHIAESGRSCLSVEAPCILDEGFTPIGVTP